MVEAYLTRTELLAENTRLWAENAAQAATIVALQAQIVTLTERLTVLEQRTPLPVIKANRPAPAPPRPARKRRDVNFARQRETPTATVIHALDVCPDCGSALSGGEVARQRQVIEVPLAPATVTEHVTLTRQCPRCQAPQTPVVDLSAEVLGQHRLGLRLLALIVVLRVYCRLPVGQVRRYLQQAHQLKVSEGEIVAVLALAAARGTAAAAAILTAIRASPWVHADETSWRQNGQNGYLWSVSTPTRHYYLRGNRQKEMVDTLLGDGFTGVLVTDFYAAYDHYPGPHQRCWTHLLRDIHDLLRKHPTDASAARWARAVRRVYDAATTDPGPPVGLAAGEQVAWRRARQRRYEAVLAGVSQRYVGEPVPQRVLCARILKYLPELFTFVADPRVPADNNAAERSVRPLAVVRKISGGTRSAAGSLTRTVLSTITQSWQAQGQHLLDSWTALLRDPTTAPV